MSADLKVQGRTNITGLGKLGEVSRLTGGTRSKRVP